MRWRQSSCAVIRAGSRRKTHKYEALMVVFLRPGMAGRRRATKATKVGRGLLAGVGSGGSRRLRADKAREERP